MSFITPMLAAPMPKTPLNLSLGYVAEEKWDGHRLIVQVYGPMDAKLVTAWSRDGKRRELPAHLLAALYKMPDGIYDGELIAPGGKSHNVTELTQGSNLIYVVFDVLELLGTSTIMQPWKQRREYLEEIFISRSHRANLHADLVAVQLSEITPVTTRAQVDGLMADMLKEGREGLILKRTSARYSPGKRPKADWIKMKGLQSAVLTVIGFEASKGEIQNRGPYAIVVLRDDDGNETKVKTIDDAQCRKFEAEAKHPVRRDLGLLHGIDRDVMATPLFECHPSIGRKIRIEFQERIGNSYRHPRWDRWEDE